jgi:hypothetical protein
MTRLAPRRSPAWLVLEITRDRCGKDLGPCRSLAEPIAVRHPEAYTPRRLRRSRREGRAADLHRRRQQRAGRTNRGGLAVRRLMICGGLSGGPVVAAAGRAAQLLARVMTAWLGQWGAIADRAGQAARPRPVAAAGWAGSGRAWLPRHQLAHPNSRRRRVTGLLPCRKAHAGASDPPCAATHARTRSARVAGPFCHAA